MIFVARSIGSMIRVVVATGGVAAIIVFELILYFFRPVGTFFHA